MTDRFSKANIGFLIFLVTVYLAACFFCLGIIDMNTRISLETLLLFGPAANLVHGTKVIWLFIAETMVFFSVTLFSMRTKRREWRHLFAVVALLVWFLSAVPPVAAAF